MTAQEWVNQWGRQQLDNGARSYTVGGNPAHQIYEWMEAYAAASTSILREALVGVMPQVQPCASAYCEEHGHTDCPFGVAVAALKVKP